MDYRFSQEDEAFRQEVRTFLREEVPADWDHEPFELDDETWLCRGGSPVHGVLRARTAISTTL